MSDMTAEKPLRSIIIEILASTRGMSEGHAVDAILSALSAPRVPEGIVYNLKELSGSRYVSYIEKMRSTECLGHAYKMQNGCFGEAELNAHTEAAKLLGEHRAFFEAAKMLTAAKSPTEPAQDELATLRTWLMW